MFWDKYREYSRPLGWEGSALLVAYGKSSPQLSHTILKDLDWGQEGFAESIGHSVPFLEQPG
jgi:hypothetical protein